MLVVGGCLCKCVAGIHTVRCLPIFCITVMHVHVDTRSNKVTFAIPHTHTYARARKGDFNSFYHLLVVMGIMQLAILLFDVFKCEPLTCSLNCPGLLSPPSVRQSGFFFSSKSSV